MAYWMTHLRVAEALLRCLPEDLSPLLRRFHCAGLRPHRVE